MPVPTLIIAGTQSGAGKTSVALGLMRALKRSGYVVQPFKVGPDFIDPSHHRAATGRVSHNLDGWMIDRSTNLSIFVEACAGADLAIIEGATGLFDGWGATGQGSAAELALWLGLPVVLVADVRGVGRSSVAAIAGFLGFDPQVNIAAVLCNQVGSPAHFGRIAQTAEAYELQTRFPQLQVLAGLPRDRALTIPSRHLGLHLADEVQADRFDQLADWLTAAVSIQDLVAIAQKPTIDPKTEPGRSIGLGPTATNSRIIAQADWQPLAHKRLGLAQDEAFCFYYEANLAWLRSLGAELVPFSPLRDRLPPDLDALYLGGGYPELHADRLATNTDGRADLLAFCRSGRPVYGECGGLMALSQAIETEAGSFPAIGALPFAVRLGRRPVLGYVEVAIDPTVTRPIDPTVTPSINPTFTCRGHWFHYSEILWPDQGENEEKGRIDSLEKQDESGDRSPTQRSQLKYAYQITTSQAKTITEGYSVGHVLASYVHLHFAGNLPLTSWLFDQSIYQVGVSD